MLTEVIMKRQLFGCEISRKSQSEYFSATDLVKAGNKWRITNGLLPFNMTHWLETKSTKEFIQSLEAKFGKVKINAHGGGLILGYIHIYLSTWLLVLTPNSR